MNQREYWKDYLAKQIAAKRAQLLADEHFQAKVAKQLAKLTPKFQQYQADWEKAYAAKQAAEELMKQAREGAAAYCSELIGETVTDYNIFNKIDDRYGSPRRSKGPGYKALDKAAEIKALEQASPALQAKLKGLDELAAELTHQLMLATSGARIVKAAEMIQAKLEELK
jgi:hypothetical protein